MISIENKPSKKTMEISSKDYKSIKRMPTMIMSEGESPKTKKQSSPSSTNKCYISSKIANILE